MKIVTRHIYGSELQVATLLNLEYNLRNNTTLNQKFTINASATLQPGTYTAGRYFAFGNGGHRIVAGADGTPFTDVIKHRSSDAALFNHCPFVLRAVDNDIPPEQRAKYGLRRLEQHDGMDYFAYYLKRLDFTNVSTELNRLDIVNGIETVTAFIPNNSNLNPTAPSESSGGTVPTLSNGNYLTATARITIDFTPTDVLEYVEAAKIIYNDERYAVVSEIAFVAGQDRNLNSPAFGGGTITMNEVVGAQLVQTIGTYEPLAYSTEGVQFQFSIGSLEALLTEA
jgi:hypothetical protein